MIACTTDSTLTTEPSTTIDSVQSSLPSPKKAILVPKKEAFDLIPEEIYRNLNTKLAASNKKISAQEVIKMYYPAELANKTSFEKIKVQTEIKALQTIVTLTHDNQSEHLLIQGHRIIMTLEKKDAHWQIVALRQQYKCWIRTAGALWSNYKCS